MRGKLLLGVAIVLGYCLGFLFGNSMSDNYDVFKEGYNAGEKNATSFTGKVFDIAETSFKVGWWKGALYGCTKDKIIAEDAVIQAEENASLYRKQMEKK